MASKEQIPVKQPIQIKQLLLYTLLFVICLGLLTLGVHQVTLHNNMGADYLIYWIAGRTLFIDGQNPYSDEVAREVQMAVWHRTALLEEDQLAFAYQPHAFLLVFPTIWMTYDWAQAYWISFLIITTISAFILIFKKKKSRLIPLVLFYYPFFFGIILGNFVIFITSLLLAFFGIVIIQKQSQNMVQILFGILIAWACVKPQFIWLFLLIILIYVIKHQLWAFLISFIGGFIGLHLISFIMYPSWVSDWFIRLNKYAGYNDALPNLSKYLASFLPSIEAIWISLLLFAPIVLVTGYLFYRWWNSKLDFILLLVWCGMVVFLVHPTIHSYEQAAFLIPFIIWVSNDKSGELTWGKTILWAGGAILTWVAYFLGESYDPVAVDALPFLAYLVWTLWIFRAYFFSPKRQIKAGFSEV
jgi:hypothetical protein